MIEKKLLLQAVTALRDLNKNYYEDSSKKKPLLEDETETTLYLQLSLKKIPNCKLINMIKVNLPHPLLKDNSEVCLIAGDLDKKNRKAEIEPDILHYKELLRKHNINVISEVVTLRQLRTEYKPYEAKQKLLAAYDIFLADKKIIDCLPRVLGKHFFKKRNFPIRVTMNTRNLKQQIEKAVTTKVFYLTGHGNSCSCEVAYLDMKDSDILDNVNAMAKTLSDNLPGSWENVMGIYLKTSLSKSIPVYISYDDPSKVNLDDEVDDSDSAEIDELSTLPHIQVKVYKDGRIETLPMKEIDEAKTEVEQEAVEIICKSKNKKKSKRSMLIKEADENTADISLEGTTDLISESDNRSLDLEEEPVEVICKSKNKKRRKKSMPINEAEENTTDISLKEEPVVEVVCKSKNKKKSKKSMLINEANENTSDICAKEESAEISRKSKSKKKHEESMVTAKADKSVTCAQNMKKRKTETDARSMTVNNKGKKKKSNL